MHGAVSSVLGILCIEQLAVCEQSMNTALKGAGRMAVLRME
jgi:hypothetical protein